MFSSHWADIVLKTNVSARVADFPIVKNKDAIGIASRGILEV